MREKHRTSLQNCTQKFRITFPMQTVAITAIHWIFDFATAIFRNIDRTNVGENEEKRKQEEKCAICIALH